MAYIQKQRGKYRARFADPLGKVQSRTFARKADAERFLRELEADRVRGQWVDPRDADMPLAAWAEHFLLLCRRLSPTTQETYRRDLEKYVLPMFGAYRLGQVPADEIENWLNNEIAAGIAPSSVHRHYRTMRRMFQVAVQKQKILANPCDRVDPPRMPKREMTFLDWDDAILLAEAHNERFRAMIYVAVDSGMRWSELVGLRRGKVDLRNGKVRVTEQLVQLSGGTFVRKEPKTSAGVRSITISPFTVSVLVDHIDEHAAPGPDGLVFPNAAGNPLSSSSFLTHHFGKAQRAVGVKCRFHDLRHTSVALAIASGAHPKAIQARMGHSSINVTLDRYGHLFPELDEAIALAFDKSFHQALKRRENVVVAGSFGQSD
ncbi:site-specific integrase [soil metagenome]